MRRYAKAMTAVLTLAMCLNTSTPAFAEDYTVTEGDSLWKIAEKHLGSGVRWGDIYDANKSAIQDPRMIYPGQVLTIPDGNVTAVPTTAEEVPYVIELDPQYNVSTDALLEKFPITYQTPAATELSQKIQNRMLNGFNRWNMGYDAWEHWGEVLYHADSIYNVHGVRLTLAEYQAAMNASLQSLNIQMGNFNNMILCDDWMAIRYDIININRSTGETGYGTTMEFAKFGDYGELGAKVDEGWGGVKGSDYSMMGYFQTADEKEAQAAFMDELVNLELPESGDLEAKYPVLYPTTINTQLGVKIKAAILNDFEHWNNGYEDWAAWADTFYTADALCNWNDTERDVDGLKSALKDTIDNTQRVRINNILVSDDWAAIHFWTVTTDAEGRKNADNHMQFLHFVEDDDSAKVDMFWAK